MCSINFCTHGQVISGFPSQDTDRARYKILQVIKESFPMGLYLLLTYCRQLDYCYKQRQKAKAHFLLLSSLFSTSSSPFALTVNSCGRWPFVSPLQGSMKLFSASAFLKEIYLHADTSPQGKGLKYIERRIFLSGNRKL